MPPWLWFLLAAVAAVAGALLLVADHGRRTAHRRERRRWSALRGWRFVDSDPVLPARWHHGVLARGGPGEARDLVNGRLFTAHGRRAVQVFDRVQGTRTTEVLVAVQRRHSAGDGVVVELRQREEPVPSDAGLDLLGPVGARYAFVTDLARARPLITPELVAATDGVGSDVPVLWLEDDWVLAAVPTGTGPARLERLLRVLGEVVDQLDLAAEADGAHPPVASAVDDDLDGELDGLDGDDLDAAEELDAGRPVRAVGGSTRADVAGALPPAPRGSADEPDRSSSR